MSLFSILRLTVLTLFVLILGIAVLVFPPGKEIPLAQFSDSNLIGYMQIKIDLDDQIVRSLIQTRLNDFWTTQTDTSAKIPRSILKRIQKFQNYAMTKIVPYYSGALLYQSDKSVNPIPLYLINARIHPSLFKFCALPISIFHTDFRKADQSLTKEINRFSAVIYRHDRFLFSCERNLCFIADNVDAFKYAASDIPKPFAPNISMMQSMLNPKSDIVVILDNRFKTVRLAQTFLEPGKFSFDSELAGEFYQSIRQHLKIYSDSIIVTGIEADIVDDDRVKGKWLVVMNDETSAKQFTLVIDALHHLISRALEPKDLIYQVERANKGNQIISSFEISGFKKLARPN